MISDLVLTCGNLRLAFNCAEDCISHRIDCDDAAGTGASLISQEGTPREFWPPSPALQSLQLETNPHGTQIALLVGMAGRTHWSMSVEADLQRNRLLFDVACRLQEEAFWLGSIYNTSSHRMPASPLDILAVTAWPDNETDELIMAQFEPSSGLLKIPARLPTGSFPQTVRWKYAVTPREHGQ